MSIILNIDTALEISSLCLADKDSILKTRTSENQKEHASWIHVAIQDILKDAGVSARDLSAIGISIGPGSYTGLRVGLATAKGLCYALNIPLIATNTLEMMTAAVVQQKADLFCPLIDARRMEVFTAIYDNNLKTVIEPTAMVIDENSFSALLNSKTIYFFGNAVDKLRQFIKNSNARWGDHWGNSSHLAGLSYQKFLQKKFSDPAYAEPLYIKEFYSPSAKTSV